MTENKELMPDEIWARPSAYDGAWGAEPDGYQNETKYIRADLVPAAPETVDLEKLKIPNHEVLRGMLSDDKHSYGGYKQRKAWNDCIDYLHANGYLRVKEEK